MSLERTVAHGLVRYHTATVDFLKRCRCLAVSLDASRVSGKDILLVAVIGWPADGGKPKVAWAPPQVGGLFSKHAGQRCMETGSSLEQWLLVPWPQGLLLALPPPGPQPGLSRTSPWIPKSAILEFQKCTAEKFWNPKNVLRINSGILKMY